MCGKVWYSESIVGVLNWKEEALGRVGLARRYNFMLIEV